MTLTRLLEIRREWLHPEDDMSLQLAERVWIERGQPTERRALAAALETILQRCVAAGIHYAPVLLQRKKALERGAWSPAAGHRAGVSTAPANTRRGQGCARCGGSGIVVAPGGASGSLCPCGAWRKKPAADSAAAPL